MQLQQQGDIAAGALDQLGPAATAAAAAAAGQPPQQYQQQLYVQAYAGMAQQPVAAATTPSAAAGFEDVAAAAAAADGQLPRVSSLNALSLEGPTNSQTAAGAAAAAASAAGGLSASAGGAGPSGLILPSPSVVTGGAFAYGPPSGSQLQLQTTGSDFANYAAGAPSAGGPGTASGYTAGGLGCPVVGACIAAE